MIGVQHAIDNLKGRGIVPQTTLGILEYSLGNALNQGKTTDAGRSLLSQSAADLKQSLANNPTDKLARFWLLRSLYSVGNAAEEAGQLEDALNWYEQVGTIETELGPLESDAVILVSLLELQKRWADAFRQSGRSDLEDRSRCLSQKMRRYLVGSGAADSTDMPPLGPETLRRILERADFKTLAASPDKRCRDFYARFRRGVALDLGWTTLSVPLTIGRRDVRP